MHKPVLPFVARAAAGFLLVCLAAFTGYAQHTSGADHASQTPQHAADAHHPPKVEIFGGYSYLRSNGHNFNGWNTSIAGNVNDWFGIAADFSAHYGSRTDPVLGPVEGSHFTYTFGPHFSYRKNQKITPFAFALVGGIRESETDHGVTHLANGFASDFGGGLDLHVSDKVGVRIVQYNVVVTRVAGHTNADSRFSFGVVFHLGQK